MPFAPNLKDGKERWNPPFTSGILISSPKAEDEGASHSRGAMVLLEGGRGRVNEARLSQFVQNCNHTLFFVEVNLGRTIKLQ
jgi:hypothetical protein